MNVGCCKLQDTMLVSIFKVQTCTQRGVLMKRSPQEKSGVLCLGYEYIVCMVCQVFSPSINRLHRWGEVACNWGSGTLQQHCIAKYVFNFVFFAKQIRTFHNKLSQPCAAAKPLAALAGTVGLAVAGKFHIIPKGYSGLFEQLLVVLSPW